ncbi:tRNA(Met) cytidine acetyltransferase TmcA [Halovenus rubra]|uniref:tRNA(Met) cytidine acetyltransferase TmcA n=2 Tax=Halovenus rubra TaxID=869890 RepID=A0ACC7DYA5_9EURY|nr:tRNA(Met) cytidine acetyltransferase TmcA [Halovenus rubra]
MDLAETLLNEARMDNQRRLIAFSGSPKNTRDRAKNFLDAVDIPLHKTSYVGPAGDFQCETFDYANASTLLGTTRSLVVLDCHGRCEPNHIGQLVGTVDGGGLFVLLTPPLETWSERRDAVDETLAVPPFDLSEVTGQFRSHLVKTLREHSGIAVVDADTGTVERDGHIEYGPTDTAYSGTIPEDHAFPRFAYEHCLTADQSDVLQAFESLETPGTAVVVEANRGRGKSTAAGIAAGCLALDGQRVVVTGPQYRNVKTLMQHAREIIDSGEGPASSDSQGAIHTLEAKDGHIEYVPATEIASLDDQPDCVFVDEAAALPVRVLSETMATPSVAYLTTTHGYEGTGRGFAVRFRDRLLDGSHEVNEKRLHTPIRYAPGDPVEVWSFRALALDARPPVAGVVADASPESVTYQQLSSEQLLADETLLREVFGLLVLAHYQTEPNDLLRLLDAPNVSVHTLSYDGHPVSVALLAREGGLSADIREKMYGGNRIRGNMIPDVLSSQLRDEHAGTPTGYRVMRIATHGDVRSRGLGAMLLDELAHRFPTADWLGVGYGATPALVDFWQQNQYQPVHLSTTRNQRSGEHSVIMLRPLSDAGETLLSRNATRFQRRLPGMLPDALSDVDPDVIRAVCRTIETTPTLTLTDWEWRHVASVPAGPGLFEMVPTPIRRLAFLALTDSNGPHLSAREERLLVRRVLQLQPRQEVASELAFTAESTCMRTLGDVVGRLLDAYGPDFACKERDRFS